MIDIIIIIWEQKHVRYNKRYILLCPKRVIRWTFTDKATTVLLLKSVKDIISQCYMLIIVENTLSWWITVMFPTPTNTFSTIRGRLMSVFCFTISQALFVNSEYNASSGFNLTNQVLIILPMSFLELDFNDCNLR